MTYEDLPNRWKEKLAIYLTEKGSNNRTKLSVGDFNSDVHIEFEDRSMCMFRYSLVIEVPEFSEIAVFTEHCGYHIFDTRTIAKIQQQ